MRIKIELTLKNREIKKNVVFLIILYNKKFYFQAQEQLSLIFFGR